MKRIFVVAVAALILAGCGQEVVEYNEAESTVESVYEEQQESEAEETEGGVDDEISQTFSDWIMGTEYGIDEINFNGDTVEIVISEEKYSNLQDYELEDIKTGIADILLAYGYSTEAEIVYSNGETILEKNDNDEPEDQIDKTEDDVLEDAIDESMESAETVNLIFIHHSVGENWLNAGLNEMLNDSGFHVADTYYGWGDMGDSTDTSDWPYWFNDDVMPDVYSELGNMTGYNTISAADGENTIIMFKSCYPNSDVGNSIEDEKEIYLSLLDYFSQHPDKMFVLVTPPPMQSISYPEKTRELANWLVSEDGWRKDYDNGNLFVFDLYNVLTSEENHHMLVDGVETHIIENSSNTLYYDSSGDDHPNDEGSYKAAEEFVPLLVYWYGQFVGRN